MEIDGHEEWSATGWFKLNDSPGAQNTYIASKWDIGANDWALSANGSGDVTFEFRDGTDSTIAAADSVTSVGTGTWYFFHAWHDPDGDEIGIRIDNGTKYTTANSQGGLGESADLELARLQSSWSPSSDVDVDEFVIHDRVLTDSEVDWLYNSGSGRTYTDLVYTPDSGPSLGTEEEQVGPEAYWSLDEGHGHNSVRPYTGRVGWDHLRSNMGLTKASASLATVSHSMGQTIMSIPTMVLT